MVGVIGAGAWGRVIYSLLRQNGVDSVITSRHRRELEGFVEWGEAQTRPYLIVVVASQGIRETFHRLKGWKGEGILIASKGIERGTLKFMHQIAEEFFPIEKLAFLGGPSFAKEVAEGKPTGLVIATKNRNIGERFRHFLKTPFLKIYLSDDLEGVEVAGAYKNVLAIAGGICEGLELGQNAKASLLGRGLVEMARFGKKFGGKEETFLGLAGAGDLFLTANSPLSRNYRVGFNLAKGKKLEEILEELGEVAEGVVTAESIYQLAQKHQIYTPIASEIYQILYHQKPISDALKSLLSQ